MERIRFYEFLPTKAREIEIQEKGSCGNPSFQYVFSRRRNRKTHEKNFLQQLELQQNVHELQEAPAAAAADVDDDDAQYFNYDDHPPQELELQQNVHEQQEAPAAAPDDEDHDDDPHFNYDIDHPPQELELQWPIVKILTKSDVDHHQNRLVLHRSHVETFFPQWSPSLVRRIDRGRPHRIIIRDSDSLSRHRLVFHRWSSNRLYVIQSNWAKEFVERRRLEEGDVIGLRWNSEGNCFFFSVLQRL